MSLIKTVIGLMSGTSMDGIDVALLRTDGLDFIENLAHLSLPYSDEFRTQLKIALIEAENITCRTDRLGQLQKIENTLTDWHQTAVSLLLKKTGMKTDDIDLIGFHGQTILHQPQKSLTVQLGDGERLAKNTNINVVYDMRANDMLYGGQGAPLVAVYHQALSRKHIDQLALPVIFVNIGGISNLTYVDDKENLIAFDCGPGNALIDQWMKKRANVNFDENGFNGLKGKVDNDIVKAYQKHRFFNQSKAGSLDWRDFHPLDADLTMEDGATTLSFITAYGIIHSLRHVPYMPKMIVVSGGGAKNKAIMKYLTEQAKELDIMVIDSSVIGLDADFIEAEAWGYLAVRSLFGLNISFPSTTGCEMPITGGKLAKAHSFLEKDEVYIGNFEVIDK